MSPTGPTPGILEVKKTNGFAIAALVCGILGFLSYGVMSILAIIFGIVARNQIRERQEAGDGMALAGLILGIISLVIGVVLLLLLAYFGNSILQGL